MSLQPVFAYDILPDGAARPVDDPGAAPTADAVYRWVHLDRAADGVRAWIERETDPLVADALLREDTRPRMAEHAGGLILILRGVNLNPDAEPEDMVSIRLWVSERLVISTRLRRLMAVSELAEAMAAGSGPSSPAALVAQLAAGLTRRMEPVVETLDEALDELEERSIDQASGVRRPLADLRRTVIVLRRYFAPQRDVLARLSLEQAGPVHDAVARAGLRETADQVTRLVEELDMMRERSSILNDQIVDARAEEMNAAMLLLSVVAAIFLPLGFLTGLLGINVGGLPGADWRFAFAAVCLICAGLAGALVWLFRRRGWL